MAHDLSLATPLSRVERAQSTVLDLRKQFTKLEEAIDHQKATLARLETATRSGSPETQAKALREALTYLMVFQALRDQVGQSFDAFERPLRDMLSEVAGHLRDREQLAALSASADALNSSLDQGEVLNQAMTLLVDLTGAERAFLMLLDETGELQVEICHNLDKHTIHGLAFAVSRTIVDTVVREGKPIVTTNAAADPRFSEQHSIAVHSLRSIICVPLKAKDAVIGVLYADHRIKTSQFSQTDSDFVAAFASQASSAIENARLFESVSIARKLMQNVVESITSGVITTDREGTVTMLNQAANRILNLDGEDCTGWPSSLVLPQLGGIIPNLVDEVLRTGAVTIPELVEGEVDGRGRVWVSATGAPLTDSSGEPQGVALVLDDRTEQMRFEQERALVKRYLPGELIDSLANLDDLQLGGARRIVSIFFADIRGFTSFSEARDPAEIVETINAYFGVAVEAIRANRGIVDKYMGDAVMAHYNSPLLPLEQHAWHAVKTAWQVKEAMGALMLGSGHAGLGFGIGVNTGEALAGNVGASNRMEYTLIGDAVNVAKRLQEAAGRGQIILGPATYEQVRERVEVRVLEETQIRGRTHREWLYELVALRG